MTQKRFIKLCMSIGIPRNDARGHANAITIVNKQRPQQITTYVEYFKKLKIIVEYRGIDFLLFDIPRTASLRYYLKQYMK